MGIQQIGHQTSLITEKGDCIKLKLKALKSRQNGRTVGSFMG